MRLRVAAFQNLYLGDTALSAGDEFEVPDESATNWLRTGLVYPADGVWPEGVYADPDALRQPEPAAPEPADESSNAHPECDPGTRPKGSRGMQVCPVDGCHCRTYRGKCQAHARSRSDGRRYRDSHNASPSLRARWDRTRRDYLRENPYCECEECAELPPIMRPNATEVDHIDGLGSAGPRGFDWSNLQALTKSHHSRKTARESFGT